MVTERNYFIEHGSKREILSLHLDNARDVLRRGLNYFLGDSAQWLSEYDLVADWLADNKRKGLMCIGNIGRGKTVICRDILPVIFRYYFRVNYFVWPVYKINDNRELLMSCDCPVFIDDIGAEDVYYRYGERRFVLADFLCAAEDRSQLVVLTTNLTPHELEAKYGQRVFDRLKALTRTVVFKGKSLRK